MSSHTGESIVPASDKKLKDHLKKWNNLPEIGSLWVHNTVGEILTVTNYSLTQDEFLMVNYRILFKNNFIKNCSIDMKTTPHPWQDCYPDERQECRNWADFTRLDLVQVGIFWQNFQNFLEELKQILK